MQLIEVDVVCLQASERGINGSPEAVWACIIGRNVGSVGRLYQASLGCEGHLIADSRIARPRSSSLANGP